jgi:hypothetical protein
MRGYIDHKKLDVPAPHMALGWHGHKTWQVTAGRAALGKSYAVSIPSDRAQEA